jgi:dipeptidyl aminopeptidase/acylaminoacyl peptidase
MGQNVATGNKSRRGLFKWVLIFVLLFVSIGAALVIRYYLSIRGMTVIDANNPPVHILDAAEVEKITTLQNTFDVFAISNISPDDSTMIIAAGIGSEGEEAGQASWMNMQTGELQPISADFLQHFPQSAVVWQDNETVVYLSNNQNGDPVVARLNRTSGELTTEPLAVNGRPLSLAPDGSRALVEVGADGGMNLVLLNLATGENEILLNYIVGGTPQSMAWTADSSKLALVRFTIPPELAADQERINELVLQDAMGNLPLAENPIISGNLVDVYDLVGGQHQLAAFNGSEGDGYLFNQVIWSPDGQYLLTRMVHSPHLSGRTHPSVIVGLFPDRVYYRVYDANLNLLGELDRPEIEAPTFSRVMFLSAHEVVVVSAHELNSRLFYFNLQTDEFRVLPTGEGSFGEAPQGFQVYASNTSRQIVYNQSSFLRPAELYRLDIDGGEAQMLTNFNAQAAEANNIRVDEISIPMNDGTERKGYLLQPAAASFPPQDVPIILYQQGGPFGAMTNRWGATTEEPFNLLPNFGFSVLFMPFSGREGFGADFLTALADDDNFGQIDIDEGAQAVQYLIDQNYASPGKVGITGCSYGGYYVAQSIVTYPDLYDAAHMQCSLLDITTWSEQNPFMTAFLQGATPADAPEEYERDSPAFHTANVTTPVLIFHGMDDFLLPIGIVRDFKNDVEQAQTPVQMYTFRNEGHELALPANRLFGAQQQITWFRTYLGQ